MLLDVPATWRRLEVTGSGWGYCRSAVVCYSFPIFPPFQQSASAVSLVELLPYFREGALFITAHRGLRGLNNQKLLLFCGYFLGQRDQRLSSALYSWVTKQ